MKKIIVVYILCLSFLGCDMSMNFFPGNRQDLYPPAECIAGWGNFYAEFVVYDSLSFTPIDSATCFPEGNGERYTDTTGKVNLFVYRCLGSDSLWPNVNIIKDSYKTKSLRYLFTQDKDSPPSHTVYLSPE